MGPDARYYRATGTSFAAPLVSGVAALLWARRPALGPDQVERMIVQSARDVDLPGVDEYSGYGLVDARAALAADPDFFVEARIHGVRVVRDAGAVRLLVNGVADADRFERARLELGRGESPSAFEPVAKPLGRPVRGDALGAIDAARLAGSDVWLLRLVVEHENGRRREARYGLRTR